MLSWNRNWNLPLDNYSYLLFTCHWPTPPLYIHTVSLCTFLFLHTKLKTIFPQSSTSFNLRHRLPSLSHSPSTAVVFQLILLSFSVVTSLNPSPQRGGARLHCFHRAQHLDLRTSLQLHPVWGQGHIAGSERVDIYHLLKTTYFARRGWMRHNIIVKDKGISGSGSNVVWHLLHLLRGFPS